MKSKKQLLNKDCGDCIIRKAGLSLSMTLGDDPVSETAHKLEDVVNLLACSHCDRLALTEVLIDIRDLLKKRIKL